MQKSTALNWDDLRFALAVAQNGSLARTAKHLRVDHTTVGRRIENLEEALGIRLFTRTSTGYVPTQDGERLLAPMRAVEEEVLGLERAASARSVGLDGVVRVTAPETFGVRYLAPRLATFGRAHPALSIELIPSGQVLDLGRQQAEIAVRFFRSSGQNLLVRRVGELSYGLYASKAFLSKHPPGGADWLAQQPWLLPPTGQRSPEGDWITRLVGAVRPVFVSDLSTALLGAAQADAGVTVLPRYLGDAEPQLERIEAPQPPTEPIWLTAHADMRDTPRVRALLDFLAGQIQSDAAALIGRTP